MNKYFIENESGEWLADPEYPGKTWTRDPIRAWIFQTDDLDGPGINAVSMLINYDGSVSLVGPKKAIKICQWLISEGCGDFKIESHEFTECWNKYSLRDTNGDLWLDIHENGEFKRVSSIASPVLSTKEGFEYKIAF